MSSKLSYLQKYLGKGDTLPGSDPGSGDKKKKKKKKKAKNEFQEKYRSRILDEDDAFEEETGKDKKKPKIITEATIEDSEGEEQFETLEDRPQIAGFVDERPDIVIMKERFTTKSFQPVIKVEDDDGDDPAPSATIKTEVRVKEEPVDDYDNSPPRRQRHDSSDNDNSPPRRRHDTSDEGGVSPPRALGPSEIAERPSERRRHDSSDDSSQKRAEGLHSAPRPRSGSSPSPPRSGKRRARSSSPDMSPPRRKGGDDSDLSPPRVKREKSDSDFSPPRKQIKAEVDSDGDFSPPRSSTTTLDGKKAGLQDAKSLKSELEKIKQKEKTMFETLSTDISGRGAETKVRGRLRAKEEEERLKKEQNEITAEVKQKYSRWSKGVRQAEVIKNKIEEDLREMDKPMARSADDVDLDAHLKAIERAEDPMLKYIKKKQEKVDKQRGVVKYPTYQGPTPAPNRFKIPPGYRWDGVDRSNGFEKKLFTRQNNARAVKDDAYKWSTEDM